MRRAISLITGVLASAKDVLNTADLLYAGNCIKS
jgi:hypothetical protein